MYCHYKCKDRILRLHRAVEIGSLAELKRHLSRKKFVLSRDRATGCSLMHKAIILGHFDIVK